MIIKRITTYYQPEYKGENGLPDGLPKGLDSFMVFKSQDDCKSWLENNGYNPDDFIIWEHHDDDIEDATVIDGDGNLVQFTGFVERDLIEEGLKSADTLDEFEELLDVYGEKSLNEEKIDDGIDDESTEDKYLMMRRYTLKVKDYRKAFTIRVYYGDVNETIGLVEISDNEKDLSGSNYEDLPTSDLFQAVCNGCSKETILDQAEGYIGKDCIREFLLACLGVTIE